MLESLCCHQSFIDQSLKRVGHHHKLLKAQEWRVLIQYFHANVPTDTMQLLHRGSRLSKAQRLRFARIVVDSMLGNASNQCTIVAKRIVGKYPNSFQDQLDGVVLGNGASSLAAQLRGGRSRMLIAAEPMSGYARTL